MIVFKRDYFDAAHHLPNYEGKCSRPHGHRWTIELGIEGRAGVVSCMVVDFIEVKNFLKSIVDVWDHEDLNDFFPVPTAEVLAVYVGDKALDWKWPDSVRPRVVRIWETPDSHVELEIGRLEE